MSKVVEIKKTTPAVKGAVLEFTKEELDYLMTALEVGYKAHKSSISTYVAPVARSLWVTLDAVRKGNGITTDLIARPF